VARVAVVVPCYNEATRLECDVFRAYAASVRFVFVNDGSTDATSAVLHSLGGEVLDLPHRGKAEAVRQGMLRAFTLDCPYAGYWDADLSAPLEALDPLCAILDANPAIDIVLGSRVQLLGHTITRRSARHYAGRVLATVASLALRLPVYDTQCGAKVFRSKPDIAALFAEPFLSTWVFDVELLARFAATRPAAASHLYEMPLDTWTDVPGSRVKPWDAARALWDMARIRRRYRR
jgi:dolichyl-phosphate beta-glucosyltransferase